MSIKKNIFAPLASGLGATRRAAMLLLVMMLTATTASAADIILSDNISYSANDGDVLTGSTSGTVTIANNAKITLSDVTITGGIVCEGTATITLVGTNIVNVNNAALAYSKAGIQIGSSGTTLTIRGSGSLTATGGTYSAGIGLGRTWDASVTAGAIIIEGGTVTASGGNGIGTGTVGNEKTASIDGISIKGGTVNASLGKGTINPGSTVTIGYIKIYDTIDMVDASKITETVTYMHVDGETATDVTANKTDYFTIGEDGDRRIITPKDDTDYTITIADGIEHGTITGAATAKYMETVTINATPDFGYHFVRLVVKDADNNDVASTNNTFLMPKSNVTVSAVFEQGTHGTTEFKLMYSTGSQQEHYESIYDGLTTVNLQQGQSYNILKYEGDTEYGFLLDNDTYVANIPYAGGTGEFYGTANPTNFNIPGNAQTGFYDITMTDVGNGKWGVSILPTAAQMDVVPDQTYTGSAITPEPLVIAGSLSLTKGSDYVYSYEYNTNVGTATVRATFQGDYESLGYVEKTFNIVYPTVTTSYVDADGTLHENVLAIPLDGSEPKDEHDCVLLSAGTYYVGNTNPGGVDASYTCLVFNGPATLILGDGATMSVNQTVSNAEALFIGANAPLTIYGQTLGTGTLTVTNNGGLSGIRSSSDITINGGIIETTGSYGIHSYSNITLNGGTITATGIMAEGTSTRITLGGATVTSSSYSAGSITIVDGMGYVDDTGAVYYGTLWSEAKAAIANKTLTKDMSWTNLKAAFEAGGTQTVTLTNNVIRINSDHIEPTGTVTLDLNGYTIDGGTSQTNPILRVINGVNLTITDSQTGGKLCESGKNETVYVGEGGSLTLQSGTINAQSIGVYIYKGSFTMTGGTITGGTVSGVNLNGDNARFTMTGGTITGGTVSGVNLNGDNARFTMTGGTITGNAEGVKVNSATAMFIVSGNVNITGNTKKDVNMYYDDQSSTLNPIHIGGTLASTARIGVYTDCSVGNSEAKAFTDGLKGRGTRENFNLKTSQAIVLVNLEDGEMAVAKPYTLSVPDDVAVNELTEASSNTYTVGYGDHITLTYGGDVPWRQSAHYTVPNGTITYLGNVDAQGRKIAFTMPNANTTITKDNSDKDYIFNGITLKETFSGNASQGLDAIFDGTSVVIVDIPNDITVKSVTYDREFKGQTPATVMLPFDYICNGTEGGKFYTFVGVEYDDNNDQWIATMEEEYDPKNRATCLERNKPYLFMPSGSEGAPANMQFPDIPGYVTLNTTGGSNGVHDTGPWRFFGVYHKKVWTEPSNDYGFAATNGRDAADEQDVSVGQFVRFTGNGTKNAFIKPMRCYLSFVGTNNARGMNRAAETEELPQSITVRLVSANGDATDIGTIDTRTGEFIPNGWYDMNGRKLNGKPAVPGIYVNNGKKIVIK